jgi:hypothetical protein
VSILISESVKTGLWRRLMGEGSAETGSFPNKKP